MYPWELTGGLMPWQLGRPFVGSDGNVYYPFADPNSPTGYSVKHTDQYGTDVQPITPPVDPLAQSTYIENTPYGRRLAAAEEAQATQNQFNNTLQRDQLGVSRMNARTNQESTRAQIEQAKQDLAFKYAQEAHTYEMARGNLGLQTAQLGASLGGVRNWDRYLMAASSAGQNPILQGALGTWSSLTGVRPNTGAVSGGLPPSMDLNSLASDMMSGQAGTGGSVAGQRNADLDKVAMGQAPTAGWWQGLSGDEQERAKGYWETHGFSPTSVLNSLAYQSPNNSLSYGGV